MANELDHTNDEGARQGRRGPSEGHLLKLCEELGQYVAKHCPTRWMQAHGCDAPDGIDAVADAHDDITRRIKDAQGLDAQARELLCQRIDWREDENEELRDLLNTIAFALGVKVHYHADNYTECENEVLAEIDRLQAHQMPGGLSWPTFDDGEPVRFGDLFQGDGGSAKPDRCFEMTHVTIRADATVAVDGKRKTRDGKGTEDGFAILKPGVHLIRPALEPSIDRPSDSWVAIASDAIMSAALYCTERGIDADPTAQDAKARDIVARAEALTRSEGR